MRSRYVCSALALAGACLIGGSAAAAEAKGWGNIKGRVVWAGGAYKAGEVKVDKDQGHCLSKGKIPDEQYVINPANNGVRWVMVWLADPAAPSRKLPVHPSLAKKAPQVVLDQPTCRFEPHVFGIQEGQVLVAKNSAPISHNVNVVGGDVNPNLNQIIPPGGQLQIEGWKAARFPVSISCSIHGWMKSWMRVFNHPYFAVTDANGNFEIKNAPAGKLNLVLWQESTGWVPAGKRTGTPVEIKAGETTDVGTINLKP